MIHVNRSKFGAARWLLLVALSAIGLVASTSAPALAQTSGTWTLTGSMKTAREGQTATLLPDGQVLVAGGLAGTTILASAELYNPATGSWTVTGSMSTARVAHTATLLPDGQVLVAGGDATVNGAFVIFSSAELYNPSTGIWTRTGSMNAAREQHTATLLPNGHVLAAGGYNLADPFNHSLSSAELYNPATGKWSLTGSLNTARYAHQAVLLANGQVLVVDGTDVSSAGTFDLNSTEVYNPATGKWTTTGTTFHAGNSAFSVTLLNTGKVLIAGGITGVYPHTRITSAAELYDPSTSTSAFTGSMNVARDDQSATLLPNGQVLAAGGQSTSANGKTTDVASAELYTP